MERREKEDDGEGEGKKRNADINTAEEKVNTASKREGKKEIKIRILAYE